MTDAEIAAVLRPERNRLRRKLEAHVDENLPGDLMDPYRVGVIEGMSRAIQLMTKRIHELEES